MPSGHYLQGYVTLFIGVGYLKCGAQISVLFILAYYFLFLVLDPTTTSQLSTWVYCQFKNRISFSGVLGFVFSYSQDKLRHHLRCLFRAKMPALSSIDSYILDHLNVIRD